MKRILSVLLAMLMIVTALPMGVLAAEDNDKDFVSIDEVVSFSDVKGTEDYASSAYVLAYLGILTGYEDGSFGPHLNITRAEMAAIICRVIGMEDEAENAKGKTEFDDVPATHWASGYINIAVREGIINGDGNGKFRPSDNVKYEEAIKMIVCALGYANDVEIDKNDWSKAYYDIAYQNQISTFTSEKGNAAVRCDIVIMVHDGLLSTVSAPVASLDEGEYTSSQSVRLVTETEDAEIYYTTDGSEPTIESEKYTGKIIIDKTTTLKAITVKDEVLVSDVLSLEYIIEKPASTTVSTGGGGGGGSSKKYTVSFDLNYEGSEDEIEDQKVKKGKTA